jgi:integrase
MIISVRGVKKATAKGRVYYYHRRTGQRIVAEPGTTAFALEVERLDGLRLALERKAKGTLGALIVDYRSSPAFQHLKPRTGADYQKVFDYLATIDDMPLALLDPSTVVKLRDRTERQRKRRFANHVIQVLGTVLNWGVEHEHAERNPAAGISKVKRPSHLAPANRPWLQAECDAVLAAAPAGLRAAIGLGMFAAMRIGDVQWVTWSAYDGRRLQWRQGKTGALVDLPAHQDLRSILDVAPRGNATAIATGDRGNPYKPAGLAKAFRVLIKRLEETGAVGRGLTFHGLRHTAATRLADLGCDPRTIAAMLGHKSLAAAIHYSNAADQRRRGEVAISSLERGANAELENRPKVFQKRVSDGC